MADAVECIYCGAWVANVDPRELEEEDWQAQAQFHAEGCEWVATRAHTQEEEA